MPSLLRLIRKRRRFVVAGLVFLAVWIALGMIRSTPETVAVLVAARDLPAGAVLAEGDLTPGTLVREDAAGVQISDPSAAVGHVLLAPLAAREPLTTTRLLEARSLAAGHVLVSVHLVADQARFVRAGDRIDLIGVEQGAAKVLAAGVRVVVAAPLSPDTGILVDIPESVAPMVCAASARGGLSATLRGNEGG